MYISVERHPPVPPRIREITLRFSQEEAEKLYADLGTHPNISPESRLLWSILARELNP